MEIYLGMLQHFLIKQITEDQQDYESISISSTKIKNRELTTDNKSVHSSIILRKQQEMRFLKKVLQ